MALKNPLSNLFDENVNGFPIKYIFKHMALFNLFALHCLLFSIFFQNLSSIRSVKCHDKLTNDIYHGSSYLIVVL